MADDEERDLDMDDIRVPDLMCKRSAEVRSIVQMLETYKDPDARALLNAAGKALVERMGLRTAKVLEFDPPAAKPPKERPL